MNKTKTFPMFWMGLCFILMLITIIFTDGATRILNSITFLLQIFIAYGWYKEADNTEKAKQPTQSERPKKKFTIQR